MYMVRIIRISHATDLSVGSAWTPQLCRRNLTHSRCPSAAARCNGVRPSKSLTPRSWPRNICLEKVDLLTVIDRVSFKINTAPSEVVEVSCGCCVHHADNGVSLALVQDATRVDLAAELCGVVVTVEVENLNQGSCCLCILN